MQVERNIVREMEAAGFLEYTEENVKALKRSDVVLLNFACGLGEKQEKTFRDLRHQFLKLCDIKNGPDDWGHSRFIILVCLLGLHEKWREFKRRVGWLLGNVDKLKTVFRTVEESVLDFFIGLPSFQQLREMDAKTLEMALAGSIPGFRIVQSEQRGQLYSSESSVFPRTGEDTATFLSLDLKSANFNTLRLLLGNDIAFSSWPELVSHCCPSAAFPEEIISLASKFKYLRSKTLGKVIPRRVKYCQHLIMRFLFSELTDKLPWADGECAPFLFTCDEMIIPLHIFKPEQVWEYKNEVERAISSLPDILRSIVRVEVCTLRKVEAAELMQHHQPSDSSSSSGPNPKKDCREGLEEGPFDGNFAESDFRGGGGVHFFVRTGENGIPVLKGLRSEARWEGLKLANLVDPKNAFRRL